MGEVSAVDVAAVVGLGFALELAFLGFEFGLELFQPFGFGLVATADLQVAEKVGSSSGAVGWLAGCGVGRML
ncbi:hypothetical protein AHiyo8_45160 [Arthrobacter sp. Hiyo8]|nr:hypothetical protein AHiyo8_45160 [Arthrobacter sp. Hiyo8]